LPVERSASPVLLFDGDSLESPRLTFDREALLSEPERDPEPLAAPLRDEEEPPPELTWDPPDSPREELPELALLELPELDERLPSELPELDERELSELLLELEERLSELLLEPE
jgi:hypothetical protein